MITAMRTTFSLFSARPFAVWRLCPASALSQSCSCFQWQLLEKSRPVSLCMTATKQQGTRPAGGQRFRHFFSRPREAPQTEVTGDNRHFLSADFLPQEAGDRAPSWTPHQPAHCLLPFSLVGQNKAESWHIFSGDSREAKF